MAMPYCPATAPVSGEGRDKGCPPEQAVSWAEPSMDGADLTRPPDLMIRHPHGRARGCLETLASPEGGGSQEGSGRAPQRAPLGAEPGLQQSWAQWDSE